MSLAIFDLDNTLLGGDSDHAWGQFLVDAGAVDGLAFAEANDEFYRRYQAGELDIMEYLAFALEPLTRFHLDELAAMHRRFMADYIKPMLLPAANELLQKHRETGDDLLIITATNSFITRPIAEALGVRDILATEPELVDERYTGRVSGTPCFQEGKVVRLQEWLKETGHSLEGSWFYSDSHNDLPLLALVDNPVAVDPDETLRETAEQRGWPVISLRETTSAD